MGPGHHTGMLSALSNGTMNSGGNDMEYPMNTAATSYGGIVSGVNAAGLNNRKK